MHRQRCTVHNLPFDFRFKLDKFVIPKFVRFILRQLIDDKEQSPGVRTKDKETLEEDTDNLLLYEGFRLLEKVQQDADKVLRLQVGIAKMVDH